MSANSCSALSTFVQSTSSFVASELIHGVAGLVRVVRRALPLVVVGHADHEIDQPLLLVEAEHLADLGRPAQHQVRAVEEDRLLGHRHDEAALGRRRRFDVVLAEAEVRIRHAGADFVDRVGDARDAGNLLAVEPRGNRVDQLRDDERLLRVGLHDLRVDHLARDVQKRGHVDAVARLQHAHAAGAARVEHPHPLAAVGHERLGQVANAEVLRLQMALAKRLGKMADGLLGAVQVVAALEFSVFQES